VDDASFLRRCRLVTAWVAGAVVVLVLGYDAVMAYLSGGNATISWCVYTMSKQRPVLPFAFGALTVWIYGRVQRRRRVRLSRQESHP
jgi:hypothetical protein